ncbi:hypothetical protein [Glycocaulis albus]|uniref:hypothetical protein n=1 Tax=Glycocaulis albus TaxID=1382801 RepID=UPI00166BD047|nr:hypothetical protein [Glycocaulis albus]
MNDLIKPPVGIFIVFGGLSLIVRIWESALLDYISAPDHQLAPVFSRAMTTEEYFYSLYLIFPGVTLVILGVIIYWLRRIAVRTNTLRRSEGKLV